MFTMSKAGSGTIGKTRIIIFKIMMIALEGA